MKLILFYISGMRRIIGIGLVLSLCFVGLVSAEDFSRSADTAMTKISSYFTDHTDSVTSIKKLLQTYCAGVYEIGGFSRDGFIYSPRQSAFVFSLCDTIAKSSVPSDLPNGFAGKPAGFFKLHSFLELGLQDLRPISQESSTLVDYCSPITNFAGCDIALIIPKLLNQILNDYINLKQPQLYGYSLDSADVTTMVKKFSTGYFNGLDLCDMSHADRQYPKTCKELKSFMNNAEKSFSDVKIFSLANIKTANMADACLSTGTKYNLLLCGLFADHDTSLQSFINLSYNELFYYRLFASYYSAMLQQKKELLALPIATTDAVVSDRIAALGNEVARSQQAFSLSLRMMRDVYSSFPLHIGFLMYQEDLQKLAGPLAKIYTPLSQLYYTLRNVQKKN